MEKYERIRFYRETLKLSQKDFFEQYGVNQSNASKYESGLNSLPDELELKLAGGGLNLDWLATGRGEMLIKNNLQNEFHIPLLSKEQVLNFIPEKEIPERKANSGEYPDLSLIPIPFRVMEYSTDLRAIIVFDSRMFPLMRSGDIAIFEATGWNGDGIYVYKMCGVLHIGYVKFVERGGWVLEYEKDIKIEFDAETFRHIGRVRATVNDLFAYDKKDRDISKF